MELANHKSDKSMDMCTRLNVNRNVRKQTNTDI